MRARRSLQGRIIPFSVRTRTFPTAQNQLLVRITTTLLSYFWNSDSSDLPSCTVVAFLLSSISRVGLAIMLLYTHVRKEWREKKVSSHRRRCFETCLLTIQRPKTTENGGLLQNPQDEVRRRQKKHHSLSLL